MGVSKKYYAQKVFQQFRVKVIKVSFRVKDFINVIYTIYTYENNTELYSINWSDIMRTFSQRFCEKNKIS
jgi:hypothetical protein